MNFKLNNGLMLSAALLGESLTLRASDLTITGKGLPGMDYVPATTVETTFPAAKTQLDIELNSAKIHGKVAGSNPVASMTPTSPTTPRPLALDPATLASVTKRPGSPEATSDQTCPLPCPCGYTATPSNAQSPVQCTLDQKDDICLNEPCVAPPSGARAAADPNQGLSLRVESTLMMNPNGKAHLESVTAGESSYTVGKILQQVLDPRPGQYEIAAQYTNLFFENVQEAIAYATQKCNAGAVVTSIPKVTDTSTSGYQVQVVDWSPDPSSDLYKFLPGPNQNACGQLPSNNN